jgi:4'-phosphopantetheinyl transferase EntD
MIERIVPSVVCVVEGQNTPQDVSLFPEESIVVRTAVEKRRREFRAGRACARLALAALGIHDVPIASGPRREPLWPAGIVGSITHCRGYVAAAVASSDHLTALGIDVEERGAVGSDLESFICTPGEVERHRACEDASWRTLLFSAKESVFKALYPLRHLELEFPDLEVVLEPFGEPKQGQQGPSLGLVPKGGFSVSAVPGRPSQSLAADLERIQGRFLVDERHVFTSAWLSPIPDDPAWG